MSQISGLGLQRALRTFGSWRTTDFQGWQGISKLYFII